MSSNTVNKPVKYYNKKRYNSVLRRSLQYLKDFPEEGEKALSWYYKYHRMILEGSTTVAFGTSCAMFALHSANTSLPANISKWKSWMLTGKIQGLCKEKQKAILDCEGEFDCLFEIMQGKTARKTSNFFANLYNPRDSNYVTIDLWMCWMFGIEGSKVFSNPRYYDFLADILKKDAEKNNLLPNQLQALIWIWLRGKGLKKKNADGSFTDNDRRGFLEFEEGIVTEPVSFIHEIEEKYSEVSNSFIFPYLNSLKIKGKSVLTPYKGTYIFKGESKLSSNGIIKLKDFKNRTDIVSRNGVQINHLGDYFVSKKGKFIKQSILNL